MPAPKLAVIVAVCAVMLGAVAACGEDTDDDVRTETSRPLPTGTITTTIPETDTTAESGAGE